MRSSLIATGGTLLAAAALFSSAAPATAGSADWNHRHPDHCWLGVSEDTTYHHVTSHGVFSGTRDADGCNKGSWGHHDDHHSHWLHRNWPTSGNGNFVGTWPDHGFRFDDD
ncbi:hypothetical protein FH608_013520 [Nonomuraea phyllanthi]|uniref:Lactococcin 972 family bacteriocin n=1 Tax=Nonomuraea phyllanthi TaxID=2219224 RepID=A0A5C4WPM6_9ACTN|nr:hypothetical protein [Nonomuraea phyllanthi]KAB8195365.1 hypothetical protein FH608_013520 [Nonomuraea phyllanthi]